MKKILLIGMAICCFLLAGAQENDNKRVATSRSLSKQFGISPSDYAIKNKKHSY